MAPQVNNTAPSLEAYGHVRRKASPCRVDIEVVVWCNFNANRDADNVDNIPAAEKEHTH